MIDTTNAAESSTHSPWLAVGFSAVIPGAGQIYNQSYWKAPLMWGVLGYFIYQYSYNDNRYETYAERYKNTLIENDKRIREFYHDQRDLFAIYFGIAYVVNLVDAYVDGHLFSFNVEEDFFRQGREFKIKFRLPIY